MTNIVQMPTPLHVLSKRIGEAKKIASDVRDQWIKATMTLIVTLAEAREQFPNDRQFSVWLVDEGHDDIGKNDRAALIAMHGCMALTQIVLSETDRTSWRLIWEEEIKPRVPSAGNHAIESKPNRDTPPEPMQEPAIPQTPIPEKTDSPQETVHLSRSKLKHLPKAAVAISYLLSPDTRSAWIRMGKHQKPIWNLLLEAIDNGAYGEPSNIAVCVRKSGGVSIRFILPWVPLSDANHLDLDLDLRKEDARAKVRKYIFPIVLANRDELKADPSKLKLLVNKERVERERVERERAVTQQHVEAVKQMPATEQAVIAYGTPLWPPLGLPEYTFDELRHAWWFLEFLKGLTRTFEPLSIRHLVKYVSPMLKGSGWLRAVHAILRAYDNNPKGASVPPRGEINYGMK